MPVLYSPQPSSSPERFPLVAGTSVAEASTGYKTYHELLDDCDIHLPQNLWHNLCDMPKTDTSITKPRSIDEIKHFYTFRNEAAVSHFINSRIDVADVLVSAVVNIRRYFCDGKLVLDVYKDPEQPDWETLALRIITTQKYPEYRNSLKRFMKEWWNPHTDSSVTEDVVVDVEPV